MVLEKEWATTQGKRFSRGEEEKEDT